MDFTPLLAGMAPHAKVAAAAFFGGVVRLFLRPASSILQTCLLLTSCVTCGYFGQPVMSHYLGLPSNFDGAIGALLGLVGVSLANGALKAADKLDLAHWFGRKELP
jgi:hypothetical protein